MAGYIGALLIGLAVGVTAVPLCWLIVFARHRRIAYQGDWFRATRRGGWVGLFFAVARRAPARRRVPAGRSSCSSRPSSWSPSSRSPPSEADGTGPPRAARGDRYDAVHDRHHPRRPSRRAVRRPQGPRRRRGRGRPRRDHRPVAPHPREPRAGVRGAPGLGMGRGGHRASRVRRRAARRLPRHGRPRPPDRRPRCRRPADRDPRRVRRAARPRPRLRPQHDGGVRGRRGDRARRASATRGPARSCSSARPRRSGGAARRS